MCSVADDHHHTADYNRLESSNIFATVEAAATSRSTHPVK